MDPQTPGTHGETSRPVQPAYGAASHHSPLPAPGQPDMGKRFLAYFIDCLIAGAAYGILSNVLGMVFGGGLIGAMVGNLVGSLAGLGFILLRDVAVQGRSPGKKVMGLAAVTASGAPLTPIDSAKRNVTLSISWVGMVIMTIPILGTIVGGLVAAAGGVLGLYECYLVITNQPRAGDKIAGTQVVVDGTQAVAV